MNWADANVIVTGASRGIGRAVAQQAARRGAKVGLVARSREDLTAVLDSISGRGAIAVADIADRQQVDGAFAGLEQDLGPTDVLVANAGIGGYGPFADIELEQAERLVHVNLLGTMYCIKAVLPGMLQRHRGHIVVVGSVAGRFGSPLEATYAATKFGQVGLAEALAVEVAGRGVKVSIVNPGVVDTEFFERRGHSYDRPFPKPIPADAVAATVVRAVEKGSSELFVPRWFGSAVAIRHLVPRLYQWGTRRSFKNELA